MSDVDSDEAGGVGGEQPSRAPHPDESGVSPGAELRTPDWETDEQGFEHHHVDGGVMVSFGQVYPGRESHAVRAFTEISRYLGRLLADDVISSFKPFFFADGTVHDVSGFFLIEGQRTRIDELRRDEEFVTTLLRAGAAVQNVRAHTLVAGSEAGRLVNLYREVREELGLL